MRLYIKLNILILFQILIGLLNITYAQNFERFSNKEGFNQNTINDIEEDRYGFLWYGTPNGLIRYDGYEFMTYTTQSKTDGKLCSNYIYSLLTDKDGLLWIGTNLGANVYVPWLERFYTVPLPITFSISQIDVDSAGRVWFSGENQLYIGELTDIENGIFKISENVLKDYPQISNINSFVFKNDNTLILGTSSGLKHLSLNIENEKHSLLSIDELKEHSINTVVFINNIFWIGSTKGLYKGTLDENRLHIIQDFNYSKKHSIPKYVNTIFEDHSGMVWIGTKDDGLYKYNQVEDSFHHYPFNPKNDLGLSSHQINVLFQDDFHVLWIGTAQGGINKLDLTQKPFFNYSSNPYNSTSISDNLITSILEDSHGRLWMSGYNRPLFRSINTVTGKTISQLKFEDLKDSLPLPDGEIIRCIYEDEEGFIWLGGDYSVLVYNPIRNQFKNVDFQNDGESFRINQIRKIIQIDKTHMLLGGRQIIVLENPWRDIQSQNNLTLKVKSTIDLKNERVQAVVKEGDNSFWIGTSKGLLRGVMKKSKFFIDEDHLVGQDKTIKLSYDNIFSLHKENNHLWIGTFGGGLNKMTLDNEGEPVGIEYFRKSDILPDDAIYGILREDDSHLWLSTDMGLVKFNTDTNNINVFDVRDGLPQNNFRQDSYFKGKSGYFYFAGLNGLTIFKPEEIKLNTQPPEVLITSLLINNKPIAIHEKINGEVVLHKSISETDRIIVSQSQTIISFNLAVKHTSKPLKNKIAFKLEGFNENWIEKSTGKTSVTYTNLSAGDYIFRIKAANGDGIWSTTEKTLNVRILPLWYNTWWSYLLFFTILITGCIGIIIYFVKHTELKQGLKYEKLDKERMEIINQGKFRYFTNLSHEFRTPLTLISGSLERIIANNSDLNNTKYLNIIEKNTKRLLSLADQLITFRQVEQGHVKLNLVKSTLGDFIYPTTEAFEDFALQKNINFFYKITQPNEEIIIDIEKFERIIFNLLSNSFKNTPIQGNVSIEAGISTHANEKVIKIDVVDTGNGISPENLDNIFERFYQLGSKAGNVSGGGIGLSFCKSLVNLLGGEISAESNPGVETRFSVKIPSQKIDDYLLDNVSSLEKSYIKDWVPHPNNLSDSIEIPTDSQTQKQYTVLIVENEVDIQNFLMTELSVKYNILLASNGVEALEKIKQKEPDLIVSDIMMPEMDGYEFCEKIKSSSNTCHIPIILLTALGDNDNIIKGLEFGADDYLSKPFSMKHLNLRISKLIETNVQIKKYFSQNSLLPKENDKIIKLSKKDEEFIKNIIDVMEQNLSDSSFGVEELSVEVGLSTSHFYRRLKQLTGQVPNVYLRNYRLQRAAELLKSNQGYNVTEVMYQIGIESNSYFSTSFKKLFGVTPSTFLNAKSNYGHESGINK